jgi:aerobic-type carbon monoxide dehydrogenase small subunit (CoxS/CutS family)
MRDQIFQCIFCDRPNVCAATDFVGCGLVLT